MATILEMRVMIKKYQRMIYLSIEISVVSPEFPFGSLTGRAEPVPPKTAALLPFLGG